MNMMGGDYHSKERLQPVWFATWNRLATDDNVWFTSQDCFIDRLMDLHPAPAGHFPKTDSFLRKDRTTPRLKVHEEQIDLQNKTITLNLIEYLAGSMLCRCASACIIALL